MDEQIVYAGTKVQHVITDNTSGGGGGGAVTVADGADVTQGAIADAAVAAGAAGTISAKLRAISRDIVANIVLAAGTNAIGKLAANSGVDIGDVDVTSVIPGVGATNLGKAEDSAHTTGDVGVMALAVRNDAGTALAGTDGDYIPHTTDSTGALRVQEGGVVSTNNSSTATLLAGATFTGTSDDALSYNEIRISIIASHASAADGLSIQQSSDNSNWDITDTYTIPATTGKTFSVPRQARYIRVLYTNGGTNQTSFRLATILNRANARVSSQRASDAYTNETDLEQNQTFNMLFNGTTWDRVRGDTTNGVDVDVTRLPALVAGSAIIGKVGIDQTTPGTTNLVALAANQSVNVTQIGTNGISANNGTAGAGVQRVTIASDSTGNIATIGTSVTPGTAAANLGKAEDAAHTTGDVGVMALGVRNDTLATQTNTDSDYGAPAIDLKGRVMVGSAPRALKVNQQTTITSSTSETTVVTAVASTFLDVYGVIVANTSATACDVTFKDSTAGTTRFNIYVPAGETRGFMLPIDAAHVQASVNNNWTATCGTSVASIKITMLAVKNI